MSEVDEIAKRYGRRKDVRGDKAARYSAFIIEEREKIYRRILDEELGDLSNKKMLEIGAGGGPNISFFMHAGFKPENIEANELLPVRADSFRNSFPAIKLHEGDALALEEKKKYDLVFQSTVFSSILDDKFRAQLAQKMLRLLSPKGIILSYDFIYNNPKNPDVKKVSFEEIKNLFGGCSFKFYKVTLAPPIGRRVPGLYKALNIFPFLRTHLITVIRKND